MKIAARIELLKKVAHTLAEYDWTEIDLVLEEYGLPTKDRWDRDSYTYCIEMLRRAPAGKLLELDDYLHGATQATLEDIPWKTHDVRVFITHISAHKVYAAQVKMWLSWFGMEGFVAHEDVEPNKKWQRVIEAGLQSCHALVALLHDGFRDSRWCDQEVGFALARKVPVVPVRFDLQPYGFLGEIQSLNGRGLTAQQLAPEVARLLLCDPRTGSLSTERMVIALTRSNSFNQSNAVAALLASDAPLVTADQLRAIRDAQEANSQVTHAWRVEPSLQGIEKKFGIKASKPRVPPLAVPAFDPSEEPF